MSKHTQRNSLSCSSAFSDPLRHKAAAQSEATKDKVLGGIKQTGAICSQHCAQLHHTVAGYRHLQESYEQRPFTSQSITLLCLSGVPKETMLPNNVQTHLMQLLMQIKNSTHTYERTGKNRNAHLLNTFGFYLSFIRLANISRFGRYNMT